MSKHRPPAAGRQTATPYLVVDNAAEAIDFYVRAFDAKEVMRIEANGKIAHAQILIGNSHIMISDERPGSGSLSPKSIGGSSMRVFLYVKNVDSFVGRAVAVGARLRQLVDEKVYGDRSGSVEDPFGHIWHVATHRRDLPAEEIQQQLAEAANQGTEG